MREGIQEIRDILEALSGVDFFNELDDATENKLEDQDTWEIWEREFKE